MGPWFSLVLTAVPEGMNVRMLLTEVKLTYFMHCVKQMKGKSGDQNEYSINQLFFYQRSSFYQKAVPIYPHRHDVATQILFINLSTPNSRFSTDNLFSPAFF